MDSKKCNDCFAGLTPRQVVLKMQPTAKLVSGVTDGVCYYRVAYLGTLPLSGAKVRRSVSDWEFKHSEDAWKHAAKILIERVVNALQD